MEVNEVSVGYEQQLHIRMRYLDSMNLSDVPSYNITLRGNNWVYYILQTETEHLQSWLSVNNPERQSQFMDNPHREFFSRRTLEEERYYYFSGNLKDLVLKTNCKALDGVLV